MATVIARPNADVTDGGWTAQPIASGVTLDASGDYLQRTANLPPYNSATFCAWIRKRSITDGRNNFWIGTDNASSQYYFVGHDSSNVLRVWNPYVNAIFTRNVGAEEWFFVALVLGGSASGDIKGYLKRQSDSTFEVCPVNAAVPSWTPSMMRIGGTSWGEWLNGDVAYYRAWDTILTEAQLLAEMESPVAMVRTGLNVEYRLNGSADTNDLSGNSRNPTIGGTLGTASGNAIPFPLFQALNEVVADDVKYVQSSISDNDTFECGLGTLVDPQVATGHKLYFRYKANVSTCEIAVRLIQGTTIIAERTYTDMPTSYTDANFTLSETEANSITDYSNLRLRITKV